MAQTMLLEEMSEWIEQHIKCIAHTIKDYKKPYKSAELSKMRTACAQLKVLFDLIDRFDIDINYQTYDKYKEFADISF